MIQFIRRMLKRRPPARPIEGWAGREYQRRLTEIIERHVERCATLRKAGIFDPERLSRELDAEVDQLSNEIQP